MDGCCAKMPRALQCAPSSKKTLPAPRRKRSGRLIPASTHSPFPLFETRETATKRFVFVAKNWFRFLGKWHDPERSPQFRPELDSFLKELRDERGYTDQTVSTRESALNLFRS